MNRPGWVHPACGCMIHELGMITSSNGNIFRVTGLCEGNSPITGEFPSQRPVERSFDVFFDLRLNKQLSNQSRGWWFETPLRSLEHNCNGLSVQALKCLGLDHSALHTTTIPNNFQSLHFDILIGLIAFSYTISKRKQFSTVPCVTVFRPTVEIKHIFYRQISWSL